MFLQVFVCPQGGIPASIAALKAPPRGEVEGSGLGGSAGPYPGGKLRGLAWGVSRPTPGGGLQAHTQGVSQYALRQTPTPIPPPSRRLTAVGSTHPTGMHCCVIFI